MSFQNHSERKRVRRTERADRKARASRRIPFHGVMTTKKIVIGQRYLAVHGLPFSPSVAAVQIVSNIPKDESVP